MHARLLAALASLLLASSLAAAPPSPALSEPSLSPDASTIAFVAGGDIWTVPASGGEARLLVANPATESRPLFSPDGKSLAFVSNRTGNGDIYVLDLASGNTRRLTYDDTRELLDGWSRDGKWIYFSSNSAEADSGAADVWRIPAAGGTPMPVTAEPMTYEYFAAPSPDGKTIAFVESGFANSQWWRKGHSHMDESLIATVDLEHHYRAITAGGAKELWPMWSADGARLFYVSDRSGADNLWTVVPGSQPQQLTKFTAGRVIWPAIANNGKAIVFERDFAIWKADPATGAAAQVPITLFGSAASMAIDHRKMNDHFTDFALSPDGKKVVFVARGDLFAASSKEGGDAERVTNTAAEESQPVWSPDSKSVVYVSDRDGMTHLYRYDFATQKESQLTSGNASDDTPRFSPDGKLIAFERDHKDLVVLDVATKELRTLATGHFDRPPFLSDRPFDFSPDSKWIAYLDYGASLLRNAWIVPVAGGSAKPASFLANTNTDTLSWSPDGKFLLMNTGQRTEPSHLVRIDVVPITPKFREEQFLDLFREQPQPEEKPDEKSATAAKPAAKKPAIVAVDFNGIRDRARVLPIGLDPNEQAISPDGKWVGFTARVGDSENVYVYSIDELATEPAVAKQLTFSPRGKHRLEWSHDSKELWYLDGGKIEAATIEPPKTRALNVSAEMDVDFARETVEAFHEAWSGLRESFFDPAMRGVDWNAERDLYLPHVEAAKTGDDFRRLLQLMVGDLNASHLGASAPPDQFRVSTGRIGVRFSPADYDSRGVLKISEVVPLSPADVAKIKPGEYVIAVDGIAVTPSTNFDSLLEYRNGKRTVITVATAPDGSGKREVILQPINWSAQRALVYRAWVNRNRDYVNRISGGRLGYVHMYDMSSASLEKLFVDLDAENRAHDGVVIDLRDNHGGFVNAYALDVFSRRPYLTMTPRGFASAGARTLLGQRALEKPTVLVINRHSLSDAEDFTEGYRAMKLGEVVGEPTAGWIIYTGETELIDGTIFRIPGTRVTDANGGDMEMHPRPVDKFVLRALGESYEGKDSQLDAAVADLLASLK